MGFHINKQEEEAWIYCQGSHQTYLDIATQAAELNMNLFKVIVSVLNLSLSTESLFCEAKLLHVQLQSL